MDKKEKIPIMIIDDEESILSFLSKLFKKEGYDVHCYSNPQIALAKLDTIRPQLVVSDILMNPIDGLQVLKAVKEHNMETNVVLITAHASVESAVSAVRGGAYDYVTKPFEIDEILLTVQKALSSKRLSPQDPVVEKKAQLLYRFSNLVGKSPKIQEIYKLLEKIAKTDSTVLIIGESGTGKELVARAIHYNSKRKGKAFVSVNCAALPDQLLESELFGHEKGSFTGAVSTKQGLMEMADQGTFLLDEVGETSMSVQAKLLRVLQEREIKRVGGLVNIPVNVRIIAATSKDLPAEIEDKKFREDLYYRLNVIPIFMPPLRERRSDIPLLVDHIIQSIKVKHQIDKSFKFSPDGVEYLMEYHWPGNIRELENFVERIYMLSENDEVGKQAIVDLLGMELKSEKDMTRGGTMLIELKNETEKFERKIIEEALNKANGNKLQAAKRLHISRQTMQYKIKKYNLD